MSKHQDNCLPPHVLQINNQECPTLFHRVTIPAEIGDDKAYPPKPGLYRNTLLVYDANKHVYMFSSDGIPTLISDGGRGVDDYNELTNKPSIEGHELVDDSSLEDIGVTDAIDDALEDYTPTSDLAEVAFSGDYDDLENAPTPPVTHFYRRGTGGIDDPFPFYNDAGFTDQATYQQFEDAILSGPVQILHEYDVAAYMVGNVDMMIAEVGSDIEFWVSGEQQRQVFRWMATDGAPVLESVQPYTDQVQANWNVTNTSSPAYIRNKPTIPTVNNATLTIQKEGSSIGTFTANSDTDTTVNVVETDPTVPSWAKQPTKPTYSYSEITDKPTIPAAQVNSDWNANSGVAEILNKPTIPTVNNATLTITQNGTSAGTFTANASSDTTISLTDTTYSDFSGATSSVAGASGLVPAPIAGDEDKALKGDGTWSVVGDVVELFVSSQPNSLSTPFEIYKSDGSTPITHSEMRELFIPSNKKTVVLHDTTSYDGVYPVIEFCYDTTEFYIFDAVYNSTYYIASAPGGGDTDFAITRTDLQKKLTAGSNITISGDTISASVELVEMSYGESNAWAKFIAAYNAGSIVYCRASSNANPATGSQTRKAFMAYVNSAESPTSVEFQYVRSVSSKTASQPVDQVFVYTLTNASGGTWTVASRNMGPKLAAGTNANVSYSNGTYTISATQPTVPEIKRRTNATTVVDISPLYVAGDGTTTSPMALKTHGDDRAGSFAYININEPTDSITEAYAGGYVWDMDESWWRKMSEVRLALYSDIPTVPTVVQTTGQSTTDVMSQKAITDIIGNVETILQTLNNGGGAQ